MGEYIALLRSYIHKILLERSMSVSVRLRPSVSVHLIALIAISATGMHPGRRDAVPETGTPSPIATPFEFSGDQGTDGKVTMESYTTVPKMQYEK